jgi:hypothetical protein
MKFWLSGLAAGAVDQYHQLFFEALGLSPGQHRIEVVHGGNNQTTPLSLAYVIIQNAPAPARSTSSPGSSSTPTPSSSGADRSSKNNGASTGAIASGAVGGIVVLVAVILFLLLLRRRRKRNNMDLDLHQEMSLLNITDPFSTPPSTPILFPASGQSSSHSPMLSGPRPGGKSEHVLQYAPQSPSDTAPQGVMRHEDSGVRLPPQESMLELPPLYTPS